MINCWLNGLKTSISQLSHVVCSILTLNTNIPIPQGQIIPLASMMPQRAENYKIRYTR